MAEKRRDEQIPLPLPPRRGKAVSVADEAGRAGRAAFARAGFTDPALLLHWEEIAGGETARYTRPLKLANGVLTLKAEPGAAVFLQHESRPLRARINAFLGCEAVSRLKFVQAPLRRPPPHPPRKKVKGPVPLTDPALRYDGPDALKEQILRLAQARRPFVNKGQD